MKLAFDGGSFQQGIAAGIYNVQVNLMNAMKDISPRLEFVLVENGLQSPINPDLLERLSTPPEIVSLNLPSLTSGVTDRFFSNDPDVRILSGGRMLAFRRAGNGLLLEIGTPGRIVEIVSRHNSPKAAMLSADTRVLGVAIAGVSFRFDSESDWKDLEDDVYRSGFYPEEQGTRWTTGRAVLRLPDIVAYATSVQIQIRLAESSMRYVSSEALCNEFYRAVDVPVHKLELQIDSIRLGQTLARRGVDAYVANHFIPLPANGIRNYAILYDIIPKKFPNFFMNDAVKHFETNVSFFLQAEKILSISQASKSDLIRELGLRDDKIDVMGIDVSDVYRPSYRWKLADRLKQWHLKPKGYVLSVGTIEPRKNHYRLVKAFLRSGAVDAGKKLVIVGKYGWKSREVSALISQHAAAGTIVLLDRITNEELAVLYSGACLMAYPSLYEGFGLPVLEAFACGCPVLTSDRSSLPEIAGDAALIVDPEDVDAIAAGIRDLLVDAKFRSTLVERGLRRRRDFSWVQSAKRALDTIQRG